MFPKINCACKKICSDTDYNTYFLSSFYVFGGEEKQNNSNIFVNKGDVLINVTFTAKAYTIR